MKSVALFSNKKDSKDAARHIIEQARSRLDFEPDLALFYSTLKYNGKYQSMLDIFHDEYGDIPQIGASVDGMIYPEDMRTDGAALVLCKDDDAEIRVDGVEGKGAVESANKLAKKVKCKNGAIVLHFPLVHVPNMLKSGEFFAKGIYYSNLCKVNDQEKQKEYALKFADYCEKENIFYLPPTILNIFAKETDYKIPIFGINVLHSQVRFNSPNIFCNFEDINGGISALKIEKENIYAVYEDIFSNKGKTLDETKLIAHNEFKVIKEFKANFKKNVLVSLDSKPPVHAIKNLISTSEEKENELLGHLEKGDYIVHRPYFLLLFNKKTSGAFLLGIGSYYPFDLFPFFMDISDYSEDFAMVYEVIENKFDKFYSSLNNLKNNRDSFVYFCIDVGAVAAFGEKAFEYKTKIKELLGKNYFGILSAPPSAYLPPEYKLRDYLTESSNNIFFMSAGTNVCLEI